MNNFRQSTLSRLQDENRLLREQLNARDDVIKWQAGVLKNLMEKLEIRESNIGVVSYAEDLKSAYDK